jgi:ATP-dependent DNA helicase DinG
MASPFVQNFPFQTLRKNQDYILNEIDSAFRSEYRYIILEAPTGIGKSPIGIAAARTLGTSYICVSTKDLQAQYARDFPFVKTVKGKNNFTCNVREDFIENGKFICTLCPGSKFKSLRGCYHTSVDHAPCLSHPSFQSGNCRYKTFERDYTVANRGTMDEKVFIDEDTIRGYRDRYSEWSYPKDSKLKEELRIWRPCEYYNQLAIALVSSHTIFNYAMFLSLLKYRTKNPIPPRNVLILDEAHKLEEEIVKFTGISISKRHYKRYIPDFEIPNYGLDDLEKWIEFLDNLVKNIVDSARNSVSRLGGDKVEENVLVMEAMMDQTKLMEAGMEISSNRNNWVLAKIKKEGHEVTKVEFKPIDVSHYCGRILNHCDKTIMMSATILDKDAFCRTVGLAPESVKFIQLGSDFPVWNRPIYPLNVAPLNYKTLNEDCVQKGLAKIIDTIMTKHSSEKGIIHTTSYKQLNFIRENISQDNRCRLLETDPEVERDEVVTKHMNATKPTVLISPSLHLGLDLKDDLSRFQIITKVPYPSLGDRWIDEKRKRNGQWYIWQTALKLVQGYGRSIRSDEDWAVTYVLDSMFESFVNRNKNILPHWFLESIKWDS